MPDEIKYITATNAAAILQMTSRRVTGLCREGKLEGAIQDGRNWKIPEETVLKYAEADAGPIAATLTGALFLSGLGEIVAVLLAECAVNLAVLPEITLAAACRSVFMVTDTFDQDCFIVIHGDPPYP